MIRKHHWWRISLLLLGLFLGMIYLLTMAPNLTWANRGADGGDLITAAATGGVAHPPGYPTYLLIAKMFQWLPFGPLAFRTNLMSAFFAVLAALLVADLACRSYAGSISIGRLAGLLAGLGFGLAPLLWSQALITEVYTLHVFFVALILWLLPLSGKAPFKRVWRDRFSGLLFGLALGNQVTVIFLLPVWLFVGTVKAGQVNRKQDNQSFRTASRQIQPKLTSISIDWQPLTVRFVWLLLGLTIYLTIPLRARSGSPVNWGNPVDWKGFWWLVSGSIYQDRVFRLGWEYVWPRIRIWAGMLQSQFGLPGLTIAFLGLFYGHPKRKVFYVVTSWMILVYSIFAIGYNSSDSYTLLLPVFLSFALWFGLGCASILMRFSKASWRSWLMPSGVGLLLFVILINAGVTYASVDTSESDEAGSFVSAVFSAAPEGAMLLAHEDRDTFALWYYHYALGKRPDVAILVPSLLNYEWYRATLRQNYPNLILPNMGAKMALENFSKVNDRPVCQVEFYREDSVCHNCPGNRISDFLMCSP